MYWNQSILKTWPDHDICWWCGSPDLSREHKYKKTDIISLYGKSFFQNDRLGMLRYRSNNNVIEIQGPNSDFLKFQQSLCIDCNSARSSKIDASYAKVIEYYLNNENQIKDSGFIDFRLIFQDSWLENKKNFYKYCVKHIGCRLVDGKISPSVNLINFLNDVESLRDVKFVFQIKQYFIGNPGDEIFQLYTGPLNVLEENHLFIGKKMTAVSSWYTIKQFSINYLYRLGINDSKTDLFSSPLMHIDKISYKGLEDQQFQIGPESPYQSFGKLVEFMEYFPFNGETPHLEHYKHLMTHES